MIGVDTNVFLRFLIDDDQGQHEAAQELLRQSDDRAPVHVHPIVWVEAAWVLKFTFKMKRNEIADILAVSLVSDRIVMPDANVCEAALSDYRKGVADIAECLLARLNEVQGCEATCTFDKNASRLPGMRLLKSIKA